MMGIDKIGPEEKILVLITDCVYSTCSAKNGY